IYRLTDSLLDYDNTYIGKDTNSCPVKIRVHVDRPESIIGPTNASAAGTGELTQQHYNTATSQCLDDYKQNIGIFNPNNFNITMYWKDGGTLETVSNVGTGHGDELWTFSKQANQFQGQNVFLRNGENSCKDFVLMKANNTDGHYEIIDKDNNPSLG